MTSKPWAMSPLPLNSAPEGIAVQALGALHTSPGTLPPANATEREPTVMELWNCNVWKCQFVAKVCFVCWKRWCSINNCLWPSWRSMINHIKNNRWIFLGGGQLHKTSWVLDPRTAPWAKRVQAHQGATLSQWTSQRTECNGTKKVHLKVL